MAEIFIGPKEIAELEARAALCESATLPGDQLRSLIAAAKDGIALRTAAREIVMLHASLVASLMGATINESVKASWRNGMGITIDEQKRLIRLINACADLGDLVYDKDKP